MGEPLLYSEPGSTWWPLAWGPGLALVGVVLDLTSGGSVQTLLWFPVAVLFTLVSAVWVSTRRKTRSMSLTTTTLRQGREDLPVTEIVDVGEAGPAMGAPVLGGGWLVPNGTDGVPLRLRDGRSVLAWARDSEAFTVALRRLLGIEVPPTPEALASPSPSVDADTNVDGGRDTGGDAGRHVGVDADGGTVGDADGDGGRDVGVDADGDRQRAADGPAAGTPDGSDAGTRDDER